LSKVILPPSLTTQRVTKFESIPTSVPPAVCISVQGMQGKGKTYFSFTAPEPIGLINFDDGWQRVIHHFQGKSINKADIESPDIPKGWTPEQVTNLYAPVYEQFKREFEFALANMRTVVVDTMTSAWAIARLAFLGTQGGVKGKQYAYSPVNDDFRRLLRLRRKHPETNIILLHREKAEYVSDQKTGNFELAGFGEIPFEVDDLIRVDTVGADFTVKILESKTTPAVTGKIMKAPGATFADVAMALYPHVDPTVWL
jgi:hypothetical protein